MIRAECGDAASPGGREKPAKGGKRPARAKTSLLYPHGAGMTGGVGNGISAGGRRRGN